MVALIRDTNCLKIKEIVNTHDKISKDISYPRRFRKRRNTTLDTMPENIYCDEPSFDSMTPSNGVYFSKCDVPGRPQGITCDDYVEPSKEGVYDYDLPSDDTYDALDYSSKDTMDSLPSVEINVHQSKDAVSSRTALYIIVVTFLSTAGIGISIYGFVYLGQVNGKCEKILIHGDEKLI